MPFPGLSLVGFMRDADQALDHLRHDCVPLPGCDSDEALTQEWDAARSRIGAPFRNAGRPGLEPLPAEVQTYVDELTAQPWVAERLRKARSGVSFRIVEIDPLLANQFAINTSRVDELRAELDARSMDDLLRFSLPMAPPQLDYEASCVDDHASSVLLKSARRDFTFRRAGIFPSPQMHMVMLGARAELPLPFVHVVRLGGRCHLHNGFHRAYAARMAGVTHLPCFFRDAESLRASGLPTDGSTFTPDFLASDVAPTMAHYTQGRAHPVRLRARMRVIHVTWHQYLMDAE
jgi:hypothetical protein